MESLALRRRQALENYRIEYEQKFGHIVSHSSGEGEDEIDGHDGRLYNPSATTIGITLKMYNLGDTRIIETRHEQDEVTVVIRDVV